MKRRSSSHKSARTGFASNPIGRVARSSIGRVRRRGAAIVFAMLALLLASMMIAALLQMTAISHRQMVREQFRLQAGLLADAGMHRALAHLQHEPKWKGEVWQISSDDLSTGYAAEVGMNVEEGPDPAARILKVTAQYPANSPSVVRVIRVRKLP